MTLLEGKKEIRGARVCVCMTVHNRVTKTLSCLEALRNLETPAGFEVFVYLVDDGSTDGTSEQVSSRYPNVNILHGGGNLYWAGGMRVAFGAALEEGFDYYLWLNDDVQLFHDALVRLLHVADRCADAGSPALVSGAMLAPLTGTTSYGAYRLRRRWHPSSLVLVEPDPLEAQACDLLNANALLIPSEVAIRLGNIPSYYVHGSADWDYSLRARKKGFGVLLAPGYVGTCEPNVPNRLRWGDPQLTLRARYAAMTHPLALPFRPRMHYLLQHFPLLGPALLVGPYVKLPLDHLRWRAQRARKGREQSSPASTRS